MTSGTAASKLSTAATRQSTAHNARGRDGRPRTATAAPTKGTSNTSGPHEPSRCIASIHATCPFSVPSDTNAPTMKVPHHTIGDHRASTHSTMPAPMLAPRLRVSRLHTVGEVAPVRMRHIIGTANTGDKLAKRIETAKHQEYQIVGHRA